MLVLDLDNTQLQYFFLFIKPSLIHNINLEKTSFIISISVGLKMEYSL